MDLYSTYPLIFSIERGVTDLLLVLLEANPPDDCSFVLLLRKYLYIFMIIIYAITILETSNKPSFYQRFISYINRQADLMYLKFGACVILKIEGKYILPECRDGRINGLDRIYPFILHNSDLTNYVKFHFMMRWMDVRCFT